MGDLKMPAWPDPNDYCEGTDSLYEESQQCLRYERARYEAAMARLIKLRKAAIRFMASDIAKKHADYGCVDAIAEALDAVGQLPDATEEFVR